MADGRPREARWRVPALLVTFAIVFATLALFAARDRSATWDEPIHLTAGYAGLARGDLRVDPSHPPLLRMWAALPLAVQDAWRIDTAGTGTAGTDTVVIDTSVIDSVAPSRWLQAAYGFAHRFMYVDNDADRLLQPARVMIVLLGIALGVLVFFWTRDWLGFVPAAAALLLVVLEPNLLAHSSLVTTDLGVTTFAFGAIYFLWKTCERPSPGPALAAAACTGLAAASKFSAVLLGPIAVALLLGAVASRRLSLPAAAGVGALMLAAAVGAIWAAYGFRYLPSESPGWVLDVADGEWAVRQPTLAAIVSWIDTHRLLPNAYTQGFLYTQSSAGSMPSFLAGERSADGWWYYFPFAFAIKTPLALIALCGAGLVVAVARIRASGVMPILFVILPPVVYLAAAMASGINLGVRHILPVYPFVIVLAAAAVQAMLSSGRRWAPAAVAAVFLAAGAEQAQAYPYPLTFFNQLAGGPANGYRYLADSNLGWGGNLERLKHWMEREQVRHVNLAYFGQADPEYYGIAATHLPGAPGFAVDAIARPTLPGYVALSPTIMHGVYAPPQWQLFYQPFVELPPAAVIGNSLRIYWVEQWPIAADAVATATDVDARRTLADALLFGMRWPEQAAEHYRLYLRDRPGDADALMHLGIALASAGRTAEAMPALHASVDLAPGHGPARLTLARALFGSGDLAGASEHGREAVRLLPGDADAHDFLGRVLAAGGRFGDARQHFQRALEIDPSHAEARAHAERLSGLR